MIPTLLAAACTLTGVLAGICIGISLGIPIGQHRIRQAVQHAWTGRWPRHPDKAR